MKIEADETLLLDLLNTTPVIDGSPPSEDEWDALVEARAALQDVVRGDAGPAVLARFVDGTSMRALLEGDGVGWTLDLPAGRSAAARAVLAWDALRVASPGRLRPCANTECRLFLIDHSKPNSARWCSMAICGNRMKARRHYRRTHPVTAD